MLTRGHDGQSPRVGVVAVLPVTLAYVLALPPALAIGFAAAYAPLMALDAQGIRLTLMWATMLAFLPGPLLVGAVVYASLAWWSSRRPAPAPRWLVRTWPLIVPLAVLMSVCLSPPHGFGLVAPLIFSTMAVLAGGLLGDATVTLRLRAR